MTGAVLVSPEAPFNKVDRLDVEDAEYPITTILGPSIIGEDGKESHEADSSQTTSYMTSMASTQPQKTRYLPSLRKSKSKDKANCEYYNEHNDLDEGELPSLHIPGQSSSSMTSFRRPVTPTSPRTSRAATPVVENTSHEKKRFGRRKKRSSKKENDFDYDGDGNEEEKGMVTIATPKLSVEDKRKHRAFWNQFDEKTGDVSDNASDESVDLPMDEKHKRTVSPSQNQNEVYENEDDEYGKDFYTMVMDVCTDGCGWIAGSGTQKKEPLKRSLSRRRERDNENTISTDDDLVLVADEQPKDDESKSMIGFSQDDDEDGDEDEELEEIAFVPTMNTSNKGRKSRSRDTTDLSLKRNDSSLDEPQNYENTKIEVEFDGKEKEEKQEDPQFLQLNGSGDVAVYSRPNQDRQPMRNRVKSLNSDNNPMPSDERGVQTSDSKYVSSQNEDAVNERSSYLLSKSKSWSDPQKNAYLHAMTLKAKEDYQIKKGLVKSIPLNNGRHNDSSDLDSLDGILNGQSTASLQKAIDWTKHDWTPSEKRQLFQLVKSEGMLPEEASEMIMTSRIRKTIEEQEATASIPMRRAATFASTRDLHQDSPAGRPFDESSIQDERSNNECSKDDKDESHISSDGNSFILSNLRKKPGFDRAVDTHEKDTASNRSLDESMNQSLPSDDINSSFSKRSIRNLTNSLKKKKGSRSGPKWHQIDDKKMDYDDHQNTSFSSIEMSTRTTPKQPKGNEDGIFDFDSPTDNSTPLNDLKLDPYHDSCDVSLMGSTMAGDQTVATHRSMYTTATNASAWSTSTRRRHRGAAKNRIPTAQDKKPVGWLDSIKAAAESSNREWDPSVGWVGYVETEENQAQVIGEPSRIGKLKAPKNTKSIKELHLEAPPTKNREMGDSLPFPNDWEKERDEMVSVVYDNNKTGSAMTKVVGNGTNYRVHEDNDVHSNADTDVHSNADTEVVSNTVQQLFSRNISLTIPEAIGEDSTEDGSEEEAEVGTKQREVINVHEEDQKKDKIHNHQINYDAQQDFAKGFVPIVQNEVKEIDIDFLRTVDEEASNEVHESEAKRDDDGVAYESIEKNVDSKFVQSNQNESDFLELEENEDFENGDSNEDFDNGDSFDFSDNGKVDYVEDDGFKLIETSSIPIPMFDDRVQEEEYGDDDVSVKSASSLMSMRAKEWRKKVGTSKRSISNPRGPSAIKEEPTQDHGNIFVSAVDENSTVEFKERPKILDVDEDDTLFDFGHFRKVTSKRSTIEHRHNKKQASKARKSKLLDDNNDDMMSEITSPTVDMNKSESTFFDRMKSCSADAVGSCEPGSRGSGSGLPRAHLQFLQNANDGTSKSQDNRAKGIIDMLTSPGLCGRPEATDDFDELQNTKQRKGNIATNYLDAIKKPANDVKRTASHLSSGSAHSDTWQQFLDKRENALSSKRSTTSGMSRAAQEYATKKVNEIVSKSPTQSPMSRSPNQSPVFPFTRPRSKSRSRSTNNQRKSIARMETSKAIPLARVRSAAEDLAAARVEAMMVMAPRSLNPEEAEI